MSSLALYRKYRSKSLKEVLGQDHIVVPLANALKNNNISHAYLFTGPRGVGKTSVARIFAYDVNGLPYKGEVDHIDIIEIDAASNRRIDEIRELREKIHIAPAMAKYKVYIIDEVHMLTKEAFNALLKTLEEPPIHSIFILATTEPHKLPLTIISRTQRHNFKPIPEETLFKHLKEISKKENITISDTALRLISTHGDGSFRDAISLLDQVSSLEDRSIDEKAVENMLGVATKDTIASMMKFTEKGDFKNLLLTLDQLVQYGSTAPVIASQLIDYIRAERNFDQSYLDLVENLLQANASSKPMMKIETSLLKFALGHDQHSATSNKKNEEIDSHVIIPVDNPINPKPVTSKQNIIDSLDDKQWAIVLDAIKKLNSTLYAILRMAYPTLKGEVLTLSFRFPFHRDRVEETANKAIVADTVKTVLNKPIKIVVECDTSLPNFTITKSLSSQDSIVQTFGGGEVIDYE